MLYFDSLPIGQGRTILLPEDYYSYCLIKNEAYKYQKGNFMKYVRSYSKNLVS